jgi:hypothetical protein
LRKEGAYGSQLQRQRQIPSNQWFAAKVDKAAKERELSILNKLANSDAASDAAMGSTSDKHGADRWLNKQVHQSHSQVVHCKAQGNGVKDIVIYKDKM